MIGPGLLFAGPAAIDRRRMAYPTEPVMATDAEIDAAVKALKIDNPIFRAEVKGNTVTLYLCNHYEPVEWTKPRARRRSSSTKN